MPSLFRPIEAILPRASGAYGGKAGNLAALCRAGFPVPKAFGLPLDVAAGHYARALPLALRPEQLFASRLVSDELLAEAREGVLSTSLAPEVVDSVGQAVSDFQRAEVRSLAVRTSSATEDQPVHAAAGLHETLLSVQGEDSVAEAILHCWGSLFRPRVFSYLQRIGARGVRGVGVVLQGMVEADVSGVLFTVNPLTSDADEMVINAAYGLGTVVTDGSVGPDTFRIEKTSGWVRDRVIGNKPVRDDWALGTGVVRSQVSTDDAARMCLDEHLLGQLVDLGRRVERHFGDPRDVEWSVAGDRLFVLQARPVTALRSDSRARAPKRIRVGGPDPVDVVWSNVNVGEALPGVATPLTWSVLSAFSELGFRSAFGGLGCRVPKHAHLVGNFRGRIYLNLTELARIAAQVPGLRPALVLPLAGAAEIERLERSVERTGSVGFLARLPLTVARLGREHLGLSRRVERTQVQFDAEFARLRAMDLRILPGVALDATLSDVHRLLNEAGTLMLTAYGGLLASLAPLRRALQGAFGDEADRWQADLLSALEGVESAHPGVELLGVADEVRQDPAACAALVSRPTAVSELPPGPGRQAIEGFLARFGHRAVREAELAEPRWRERPELLFDSLRLQLGQPPPDVHPSERARARLAQAQARLRTVREPLRTSLRALLRLSRHYIRLRERLRSRVTVVLDLFRWIALDANRRLAVREPESGPDAAFFLTLSELHSFLRGDAVSVAPAVHRRRAQYDRDRALPAPPDTFVGYPRPVSSTCDKASVLAGLPASGGSVEGRVCVMSDPSEASRVEAGDVLVVPCADVGWTPLFLLASALVTDAGGPLSHACVVAREFGLPAAVNLKRATHVLRTGERVLVDGDAGTVTRLM